MQQSGAPVAGNALPETVTSTQQLHDLLSSILSSTDNNHRRQCEAIVVRSLKNTSILSALVSVIQDTTSGQTSGGVRQLAAVLLQKKVLTLWRSLPRESQTELKAVLLQQLGAEPVRVVRFAIAHVISRLCKAEAMQIAEEQYQAEQSGHGGGKRKKNSNQKSAAVPPRCWPELQQGIRSAAASENPDMRELAMVLAYSIAEVFTTEGSMSELVTESVLIGVADPVESVQIAALRALSTLLPFLHSHKEERSKLIAGAIPVCVSIVERFCAEESRINLVIRVIEVLGEFIEELTVKNAGEHLMSIAACLVLAFRNPASQPRVRQNASETIAALVNSKPKYVVSHGILNEIAGACVSVLAEDDVVSIPKEYNEDEDDMDDDDLDLLSVEAPCLYTCRLLCECATKLPAKQVTAVLMPYVAVVSENAAAEPRAKKAAIIVLACVAQGNPGSMRRKVSLVLQLTEQFLKDAAAVVREAAAYALSYFCLYLQPEILTQHARIFQMLVPLLNDPTDAVRRSTADALDHLCENVAENLEQYIPDLLLHVTNAITISSLHTQEALCRVLSSVAMTQCPSFVAHAEQCLQLLKMPFDRDLSVVISAANGGDVGAQENALAEARAILPLRAQATETVGIIANAMGRDAFRPYLPYFMDKVAENLRTKRGEVREQSFGFLGNICEAFREEFLPFLDDSIKYALESLETDNAHYENKHLLAEAASSIRLTDDTKANAESGDDDEDDDDEDGDDEDKAEEIHMRVRTADVEEKSSAAYAIGVFAFVLKSDFGEDRIRFCWDMLMSVSEYFHANVRSNVLVAVAKLATAAQGSVPVVASASQNTLSPFARELVDECVYDILLPCIKEENEKEVVAAACEALQVVVDFYGMQSFSKGIDDLIKLFIQLLQQKTVCQRDEDEDEDISEDDSDDDEDDGKAHGGQQAFGFGGGANAFSGQVFPSAGMGTSGSGVSPLKDTVHLGEDHDNELIDSVCDLIESVAKACGPSFSSIFAHIAPSLLLYTGEDRPCEDLVMATGAIANILIALGHEGSAPFFTEVVQLAFHILSFTDDSAAKANSCFVIRAAVESCPTLVVNNAQMEEILRALYEVIIQPDEIPEAVDNSVSAVCVIVRKVSPALVPFSAILPALLQLIPMRVDKAENTGAIETLLFILLHATEIINVEGEKFSKPGEYTTSAFGGANRSVALTQESLASFLFPCIARTLAEPTVKTAEKEHLVRDGLIAYLAGASESGDVQAQRRSVWMQVRSGLPPALQETLTSMNC